MLLGSCGEYAVIVPGLPEYGRFTPKETAISGLWTALVFATYFSPFGHRKCCRNANMVVFFRLRRDKKCDREKPSAGTQKKFRTGLGCSCTRSVLCGAPDRCNHKRFQMRIIIFRFFARNYFFYKTNSYNAFRTGHFLVKMMRITRRLHLF